MTATKFKAYLARLNSQLQWQPAKQQPSMFPGAQVEYFSDFTKVANGAYTAPVYLTDTTATAQDGVVTMDVNSHGLSAGDD